MAAVIARQPLMVQRLIQVRTPVDPADKEGNTALMYAASSGEISMVMDLLEAQAPIVDRNALGQSAVDLAQPREIRDMLEKAAVQKFVRPSGWMAKPIADAD